MKRTIFIFFYLAINAIFNIAILSAATTPPATNFTVNQRTDLLKQDLYANLCGYYALWNIYAEQQKISPNDIHAFHAFKEHYQTTYGMSASALQDYEIWGIIDAAELNNTLVIPNADFLLGNSIITSPALQAIYEEDGRKEYLTQALQNYNAGQKIYFVINPRAVNIGAGGEGAGIGHWFVMTIQKTATDNLVTIYESYPAGEENPALDILIAQKMGDGLELDAARETAEKELSPEVEGSSYYEGFVDRRAEWPHRLVSFITALSRNITLGTMVTFSTSQNATLTSSAASLQRSQRTDSQQNFLSLRPIDTPAINAAPAQFPKPKTKSILSRYSVRMAWATILVAAFGTLITYFF